MEVVNLGSLAVVTQTVDARQINRELRSLDPNLFLDFETVTPFGLVPVIKEHIGSAIAPLEVFRWQEPGRLAEAALLGDGRRVQTAGRHPWPRHRPPRRPTSPRAARRMHARRADDDDSIEGSKGRVRAAQLDSLPPGWRPKHFGKK
jgi:hypothetical protein